MLLRERKKVGEKKTKTIKKRKRNEKVSKFSRLVLIFLIRNQKISVMISANAAKFISTEHQSFQHKTSVPETWINKPLNQYPGLRFQQRSKFMWKYFVLGDSLNNFAAHSLFTFDMYVLNSYWHDYEHFFI